MKFGALTVIWLGCLTLGCGTPIFSAHFDSEALNREPSRNPPGPPDGDSMYGPLRPRSLVINAPEGMSGRAVKYTAVNTGQPIVPLWFLSREVSPDSQRYYVKWRAIREYRNGVVPLKFSLENARGNVLAKLELSSAIYYAVKADGSKQRIAAITDDVPHQVGIIVHPDRTYTVVVADNSNSILGTTGNLPLLSNAAIPQLSLVLYYPSNGHTSYVMDDVVMTEECPGSDDTLGDCE